jgi:hypothetical protein
MKKNKNPVWNRPCPAFFLIGEISPKREIDNSKMK